MAALVLISTAKAEDYSTCPFPTEAATMPTRKTFLAPENPQPVAQSVVWESVGMISGLNELRVFDWSGFVPSVHASRL